MPIPSRNIPVVTKLTAEFTEQSWYFGPAQRISVADPTVPSHFPCHITGTSEGLLCAHGSEMVGIPWSVLRAVWESANPKLTAPPAPKNSEVAAAVKAATAEAAKLP
jgi:hypothetical protein